MHLPTVICAVRDVTLVGNVFLFTPWDFHGGTFFRMLS